MAFRGFKNPLPNSSFIDSPPSFESMAPSAARSLSGSIYSTTQTGNFNVNTSSNTLMIIGGIIFLWMMLR